MIRIPNQLINGLLVWWAIAGCQDIQTPARDVPAQNGLLAQLQVTPRGITMAVGDIEPMSVTAFAISGDTIPMYQDGNLVGALTYPSLDTSRIEIQADGSIRAKNVTAGTNPLRVITAWTYRGVTKRDTTYVRINATRPARPIIGMSLQPPVGDSAKLGYNLAKILTPVVYHDDSSVVANTHVFMYSSRRVRGVAPEAIDAFSRRLTMNQKGRLWVYAVGRVYGATVRDSVEWTGTEPVSLSYSVQHVRFYGGTFFTRDTVYMAPCGRITVQNSTGTNETGYSIRATLNNPSRAGVCQTGDIAGDFGVIAPQQTATRAIPDTGELLLEIVGDEAVGNQRYEIWVKVR